MISLKLKNTCLLCMVMAVITQSQSISDSPIPKQWANPSKLSNEVGSWQSSKSSENSLSTDSDQISSSESSNAHRFTALLADLSREKPISRLRLDKSARRKPRTPKTSKLSLPIRSQRLKLNELADQESQDFSKNMRETKNGPMKYDIPLKIAQGSDSEDGKAQRLKSSSLEANEIPTVGEPLTNFYRRWEATPKADSERTTVRNYFLEQYSDKKTEGKVIPTEFNPPHSKSVESSDFGLKTALPKQTYQSPEMSPDAGTSPTRIFAEKIDELWSQPQHLSPVEISMEAKGLRPQSPENHDQNLELRALNSRDVMPAFEHYVIDPSEMNPQLKSSVNTQNSEVHFRQNSSNFQTIPSQMSLQNVQNSGTAFRNLLNSQEKSIPSYDTVDSLERAFAPRGIGMKSQPFPLDRQTFCSSIMRLEGTDPHEDPTLKLQRSSQFIPFCPEVHNITEIYSELCEDWVSDDEFFEELKKKKWTEDILKVQGLSKIPTLQSQNAISTSSFSPPSSEALKPPSIQTWQPSSESVKPLSIQTWQPSSESLKPLPIQTWQPSSVVSHLVGNEIDVKPLSNGWGQLPTRISANDLAGLNNFFIPLEARTYPPGACVPANQNHFNYPFQETNTLSFKSIPQPPKGFEQFQETKTLSFNSIPQQPKGFEQFQETKTPSFNSIPRPPKGFEQVLSNCDNIINREIKISPEVVVPPEILVPEIKVFTSEIFQDEKQKEHEKHKEHETHKEQEKHREHEKKKEPSSAEGPVIGVELFPEFNQVTKTKILKAQKIEKDGNVIFLPETRSKEHKDEKEETLEVEVHVTTFNCTKRDTPENERVGKIDLKELHKGETWPHLTYLKLIPLSESFEQELQERDKSEEVAELLKANATADIKPINQTEAGE